MTKPGANDWIICVKSVEGLDLHSRFPDATLIPINSDQLRGRVLKGRAFITYLAVKSPIGQRIREQIPICAASTGADPRLHILEWPAGPDGRPRP